MPDLETAKVLVVLACIPVLWVALVILACVARDLIKSDRHK